MLSSYYKESVNDPGVMNIPDLFSDFFALNASVLADLAVGRCHDALFAFLAACALGLLRVAFPAPPLPVLWRGLDGIFTPAIRRLDRVRRSRADRLVRGILLLVIGAAALLLLRAALMAAPLPLSNRALDGLFLILALAPASPVMLLAGLPTPAARSRLGRAAGYDFDGLDDTAFLREKLLHAVQMFHVACVLPLVWYVAFGGTGLLLAVAGAWALSRFGGARGDDGMGAGVRGLAYVFMFPTRLVTGWLVTLAAFLVPGTGKFRAVLSALVGGRGSRGDYPVAVFTAALNAALGGPVRRADGTVAPRPWMGPPGATAQLTRFHGQRGVYLCAVMLFWIALMLCAPSVIADMHGMGDRLKSLFVVEGEA